MPQDQNDRFLDEAIAHAKAELEEHAALERARVTAAADAALQRLAKLEAGIASQRLASRADADAVRRQPRRFERGIDPPPAEDVPAGALLIARRMADEGHTREEVADFLAESFRRIDVPAAIDHAFQDAPTAS